MTLSGCQALHGCERRYQCARYHRFIHSTPYEGFNARQTCRVSEFTENSYPHFVPWVRDVPEGCQEIPGYILEVGDGWVTQDGQITETWAERGVWPTSEAAMSAMDELVRLSEELGLYEWEKDE